LFITKTFEPVHVNHYSSNIQHSDIHVTFRPCI